MHINDIELLKKLSLAFGPSGCEDKVAAIIKEAVEPYADEIFEDRCGTLVAKYKAKTQRTPYDIDGEPEFAPECPDCSTLLLHTHMDEGGYVVKQIDDDGFIKVKAIGTSNPMFIAGRNVTVGNEENETIGYFGAKAVHMGGVGDFGSMFIDIGAKNKEECEKLVSVADFAVFRSDFVNYGENNERIKGKAFGGRIGCYVLISVLKELAESKTELPYDICFAFTRCGEIGVCGEKTAAKLTSPDLAITVDCAEANDIENKRAVLTLGEGASVSYADRGCVYDRELTFYLISTAKNCGVKYQIKKSTAGNNGASGVQRSFAGVKCASVAVPVRYKATSANVADLRDISASVDLIISAVKGIK